MTGLDIEQALPAVKKAFEQYSFQAAKLLGSTNLDDNSLPLARRRFARSEALVESELPRGDCFSSTRVCHSKPTLCGEQVPAPWLKALVT
jgi:hypothetical protein